jgi:hypothetical protein
MPRRTSAAPIRYHARKAIPSKRMPNRPRKSSGSVSLVLLATLVACSQSEDMRRDVYASRDDCVKDWGDEVKCEPTPFGHHIGSSYWYGPAYRSGPFGSSAQGAPPGSLDNARPGSHALGTSHVSRGGFGASGAAHGSGGG